MKKVPYIVLVVALIAGLGFLFFYTPCKEPNKVLVGATALNCAYKIVSDRDLPEEACQTLKGNKDCQFDESDKDAVITFINDKVLNCVKETLTEKNYCTDKVEEILK